ncbi:lipid A export permease/ATP-binding protein MsbA [Marinobacterium sp. AK62]|uniref:Lipid A export permease/ATP-binding protein MsbA n=1 Tax=Marinobacterium alkalitolerans TaxID=1542925 RepID=A0ABS3Z7J3_9GAMM|nr:lipid A export permease/ATP-binding protein MsbA [Marinobacterium alkalitolerans]MBP0047203.1 lipid A export permease/ATP-binding protein MsbA [Marinobacterium alkalitolerans]
MTSEQDKSGPDAMRSKEGWSIYKRLLTYVMPYWPAFLVSFIGFAIYGAGQALSAKWLEQVVDTVQREDFEQRTWLALAVLGIFLMRGVGTFIGNYSIAYVGRETVHRMRSEVFEHLLFLPSHFYSYHASGELLAKLTYNVEQVTGAVTNAIKIFLRETLTLIGLMAYMFYLNWKLTLIFIAAGPLIGLVVSMASKRMRRLSRRIQQSVGDITESASEAIKGYQVVRVFGGASAERQRFQEASLRNKRQFMKLVVTQSLNTPVIQMLIAVALSTLLYLAMHPDVMGDMTTGGFVAFLTAAGMLTKPVRQLTDISAIIQRGIAAAESLFEVLDEPVEQDRGNQRLEKVGDIEFKQLNFTYPNTTKPVLRDISLRLPQGKSLALVGRSGSGKSTLASLLPRFNDGWDGELLINGVPVESFTLASLRDQISLVNQNVVLFNGTIAENIAYGAMAGATEEQILAAAEAAHVNEFAARLPDGIHTPVGENGVLLSGGQRQRIAIARAILKDAPILILDEATSALDTESERHIQQALEEVMKGRTTLVIAHRLSTIEKADIIAVMDDGKVVEQGSHPELLDQQGAYAKFHILQSDVDMGS